MGVGEGKGGIVSREVIDVHTGMIFRPRFKSLVDATVVADTDKSGYLLIGGGRLKPNGEPAEREVFWAYWKNHADERGELLVRDGLPRRFGSLESGLDESLKLVSYRGRYTTAQRTFQRDVFNSLNRDYQIHYCRLDKDGILFLGGERQVDLGPDFAYRYLDVTGIENPAGDRAMVTRIRLHGERFERELPLIYGLEEGSQPWMFRRGNLIGRMGRYLTGRLKNHLAATAGGNYILTGLRTSDVIGGLFIGRDRVLPSSAFHYAGIEAMFAGGKPKKVLFHTLS